MPSYLELPIAIEKKNPFKLDRFQGPYPDTTTALATYPIAVRQLGDSVFIVSGITVSEYWFQGGINDVNLVPKTAASGYLSLSLAGQSMTTNFNLAANASNPLEAVTFQQFSNALAGLQGKPTARVRTTTALPANTYNNGTAGVGATLTATSNGALTAQDGVTLVNGNELFVFNEATLANNGLYIVTQIGSAGTPYILTRDINMDANTEFNQAFIVVGNEGSTKANTLWVFNYVNSFTTGTSQVTFTNLNPPTSYTSSAGITLTGTNFTIDSTKVPYYPSGLTAGLVKWTGSAWIFDTATYITSATAASTYVALAGSYSNPSWITSLAWSKVTGTPTTLGGYGITDAYPLTGNPSSFLTSISTLTLGTGLTGTSYNGTTGITAAIDTTKVPYFSGGITGTADLSSVIYGDGIWRKAPIKRIANYAVTTPLSTNTYNNGTSGVGATLTATANGALLIGIGTPFTPVNGSILVIAAEVTNTHNGIYVVTDKGSVSTPYILTRDSEYNTFATFNTAIPLLVNGGEYAGTLFRSNFGVSTIGTSPITYSNNLSGRMYTPSYGASVSTGNLDGRFEYVSGVLNFIIGTTRYQIAPFSGFTNPMTTVGDIIIGGTSGVPTRLSAGTNGYVLTLSSGSPTWSPASAGVTAYSALTDVNITSIADGQLTQYRTGNSKWNNFTLGGDATISNVGALTIANNAITYTKFQNIPTLSILGNSTGGSTIPQAITLGTGLKFSGTTIIPELPISRTVTTNFTLLSTDLNSIVFVNTNSNITATLPDLGAEFVCQIIQLGTGIITFTLSSPIINYYGVASTLQTQYGGVTLYQKDGTSYNALGALGTGSGGGTITTLNNGLTLTGSNGQLGGNLTQNTSIDGAYNFYLGFNTPLNRVFFITDGTQGALHPIETYYSSIGYSTSLILQDTITSTTVSIGVAQDNTGLLGILSNGKVQFSTSTQTSFINSHASFDYLSTTGFLFAPRMSTTQQTAVGTLGSGDKGAFMYNTTTDVYQYYNGTSWINLTTGGGGSGTVTSVTSSTAEIIVATSTTTPILTIVSAPKWTTAQNLAGNSVDGSATVAFVNKFIVQGTTDTGLTGSQFLGALGTGIVKNTTTTGVLSIAIASDFPTLNQNTLGNAYGLSNNPMNFVDNLTTKFWQNRPTVGRLFRWDFLNGSTGWTQYGTGATMSVSGGFLNLSSGGGTSDYTNYYQYDNYRFCTNDPQLELEGIFPITNATNAGEGIGVQIKTDGASDFIARLDLSNTGTRGQLKIYTLISGTPTLQATSPTNLSYTTNVDQLSLKFRRRADGFLEAKVINITVPTNTPAVAMSSQVLNGIRSSKLTISQFGGSTKIGSLNFLNKHKAQSTVMCTGDSVTPAYYIYYAADLVYGSVLCSASGQNSTDLIASLESLLNEGAQYAMLMIGMNDAGASVSTSAFIANLKVIVAAFDEAGIIPIICYVSPNSNTTQDSFIQGYNAAITTNFATQYRVITTTYSCISNGNTQTGGMNAIYTSDGTHPNAAGGILMAKAIETATKDLIPYNPLQLDMNNAATGNNSFTGYSSFGSGATINAPSFPVSIFHTDNTITTIKGGLILTLNHSYPSTPSQSPVGIFLTSTFSGSQNYSGISNYGHRIVTNMNHTSTSGNALSNSVGIDIFTANLSTGTATQTTGINISSVTNSGGGIITTNIGMVINDQTVGSTNIGIKSLVSSGSNKYNIFSSGTAQNIFGGNIGVGYTSGAPTALLDLLQPILSGTGSPALKITAAAHTALTASTEFPTLDINLARTVTWSTGALGIQREIKIQPPTYAFTGVSTLTTASLMTLGGAPVAGTNATFTTSTTLTLQGNNVGSGVTSSYGLQCAAPTNATSNYSASFTGGNVGVGTSAPTASLHVVGSNQSGGLSPQTIIFTPGSYTNITSGQGSTDYTFNGGSKTWLTTAPSTQQAFVINAPTYSCASTVNLNNSATFYVNGPPTAGGSLTLINTYAMWINAGLSRLNSTTIAQTAMASAWIPALTVGAGAHTALTASTEFTDVIFNTRTVAQATGNITTQRWGRYISPTITFTAASTITNAIGFEFVAPIAGTNATFTNSYAINIVGNMGVTGNSILGGNIIGGTGFKVGSDLSNNYTLYSTSGANRQLYNSTVSGSYTAGSLLYSDSSTTTTYYVTTVGDGTNISTINIATAGISIDGSGTGGNLKFATAGLGLYFKAGSNQRAGTATLVAGTVTVSNTTVTANTVIVFTPRGNSNAGALDRSATVNGTSFTIRSVNPLDARVVDYIMIEVA